MLIFKCKMCGGDIQATEGQVHGTCDSCGTTSTLPKANDERIVNLFNRANQQRQKNDFDKAMANYENILNEDATNAEAHWGVVLCRYGIEYVEDPRTHERIPTCHRVQYESILSDNDYLAALENAPDSYARELYENEAKKISEIQKGILAISNTEEPYDVFICYKETTDGGSRTKDSALAQDIYYQLEKEGYKTFFSRITLEGKLGQQYEPYIFAALNSAKVMLVIGTDPAYFNAVWVRNEWSRFLLLMKKDRSKLLIPCYKDMDAYDIPNELSMYQSQDMGKIGFIQDLIHGIKKVISKSKVDETKAQASGTAPVYGTAGAGVDGLLKRAFIFLEDGDFKQANDYCDRVLDIDPENARAYVGLLLVELKIKKEKELSLNEQPLDQMANYQKAVRYSDEAYRNWLEQCNQYIIDRIREKEEQERERQRLIAEQQQKEAEERAEQERYITYNKAVTDGKVARKATEYLKVTEAFRSVGDYHDAPAQVEHFRNLYLRALKTEKRRKFKIAGISVVIVIASIVILFLVDQARMIAQEAEYRRREAEWEIERENEREAKRLRDEAAVEAERERREAAEIARIEAIRNAEQGDVINFANEEWIVLEAEDEKIFILSVRIIEMKRRSCTTWNKCRLRVYLNFHYYETFKDDDKRMIIDTYVVNKANEWYGTPGGSDTTDKIFLLSIEEVVKYFGDSGILNNRPDQNTKVIKDEFNNARIAYIYEDGRDYNRSWWLRSPGTDEIPFGGSIAKHVAAVLPDGVISVIGIPFDEGRDSDFGVRPAMWITKP